MPEEKPKIEKIETFQDIRDIDPDEEAEEIKSGELNPLNPASPTLQEGIISASGLTGGKYLGHVEEDDVFTTTSGDWEDVTGLTKTVTLNKKTRVLLLFSAPVRADGDGDLVYFTFEVDGTDQATLCRLCFAKGTANPIQQASMFFITSELEGSKTFKVRVKDDGTNHVDVGYSTTRAMFAVIELSKD